MPCIKVTGTFCRLRPFGCFSQMVSIIFFQEVWEFWPHAPLGGACEWLKFASKT